MSTFTVVAAAVEPLRAAAILRAQDYTRDRIAHYKQQLAANGWDVNAVAPRPHSRMSRSAYAQAGALRAFVTSIVDFVVAPPARTKDAPVIVEASPEREEHMINRAGRDASEDFDVYVNKLADKAGDGVVDAAITGCSLWEGSLLTVVYADRTTAVWKTQQIINISVLGKMFNQWPTRRLA